MRPVESRDADRRFPPKMRQFRSKSGICTFINNLYYLISASTQKIMVVSVKCRQPHGIREAFALWSPDQVALLLEPTNGTAPHTPIVALHFGFRFVCCPTLQISCAPLHWTEVRTGAYADNISNKYVNLKKLVPWGTDGRLPLSDLDLDLGSGHTAYRRASLIDLYLRTKFHWDRKTIFFWKSPLRFWSSSESWDTKTRTNIKNPARSNLDIVL